MLVNFNLPGAAAAGGGRTTHETADGGDDVGSVVGSVITCVGIHPGPSADLRHCTEQHHHLVLATSSGLSSPCGCMTSGGISTLSRLCCASCLAWTPRSAVVGACPRLPRTHCTHCTHFPLLFHPPLLGTSVAFFALSKQPCKS